MFITKVTIFPYNVIYTRAIKKLYYTYTHSHEIVVVLKRILKNAWVVISVP